MMAGEVFLFSPLEEGPTNLLLGFGKWLTVNGEAIYGTRHWQTYGEGTTAVVTGQMNECENKPFTAEDIRFTTKGNALYAFCLGWPGKEVTIKSFGSNSPVRADMITDIWTV